MFELPCGMSCNKNFQNANTVTEAKDTKPA